MEDSIEIVKEIYTALNRNDIASALKNFASHAERVEWKGHPTEGNFHGIKEVTEHFKEGRSTWAEGGCEPERFFVEGNKVVAFIHVHVRLKASGEWVDGHVADVYTFENGKIIHMRSFLDRKEALEWAGVKP